MPTVGSGMVARYGKRHKYFSVFFIKFAGFHGWKIIFFVFIIMYGKMTEAYPGQAGNGICVRRRKDVFFLKDSMVVAEI